MILILKQDASEKEVSDFKNILKEKGFSIHESFGIDCLILKLIGDTCSITEESLLAYPFVSKVIRIQEPYKLTSRRFHQEDTVITLKASELEKPLTSKIGKSNFSVIAGPCSVESEDQIVGIARCVKASGAAFLRGGAFKPRTSPYTFQGMGAEGITLLLKAKKATGLPIVSEIMSIEQLPLFENVDIIQVGTRNMQNFTLLKELGKCGKPILLKRGLASTAKEFLMSAEYIMSSGNEKIILCERGIRSFDNFTRNTLDLSIVPYLKKITHLPVIVDPSHATGLSWMVPTMAKAALASGADGIIIEVHNNPPQALCDGEQSITPKNFDALMKKLRQYAKIENLTM
ncbi:MAG: 3-deoxy-7-phosphoheptulonate synthase [Treponemataceae bacterium]